MVRESANRCFPQEQLQNGAVSSSCLKSRWPISICLTHLRVHVFNKAGKQTFISAPSEVVQPLWKAVCQFLKKWTICLSYHSHSTPGYLPREMNSYAHMRTGTQIFIQALYCTWTGGNPNVHHTTLVNLNAHTSSERCQYKIPLNLLVLKFLKMQANS